MATEKFTLSIDRESDGRWIAEVDEVPGAMAYGETISEAVGKALEIAGLLG
jgi:predicted RNase H-like HicB family nuclease